MLAENLELYNEFQEYLGENQLEDYYARSFEQLKGLPESQGKSTAALIGEFVLKGGVIEVGGSGFEHIGARLIPDWDGLGSRWYRGQEYPEDENFPFEDSQRTADAIVNFVKSPDCTHSDQIKEKLLSSAATLMRYTQKLSRSISYGKAATHLEDPGSYGEGVATYDELVDRIEVMPTCSFRDHCVDSLFQTMLRPPHESDREREEIEPQLAKRLMRLYSIDRFRSIELESDEAGINTRPLISLPLSEDSFDIAEMYPFRNDFNDGFVGAFGEFAQMLDKEFEGQEVPDISARIDQAVESIPHASIARDYLIEKALLPLMNGDERYAHLTEEQRQQLLVKAYEAAGYVRTKTQLGKMIAEDRIEQLGDRVDFDQGIEIILDTMPQATAARDGLVNNLLNSTFTTWLQIKRAEGLMLGHDYRTDRKDIATRNALQEAVFEKIEGMSVEERVEMVIFLLDTKKHVLKGKDLSEEFFDGGVKEKLKQRFVGRYYIGYPERDFYSRSGRLSEQVVVKIGEEKGEFEPRYEANYEFSDEVFEQHYENLRNYFIANFKFPQGRPIREDYQNEEDYERDYEEYSNGVGFSNKYGEESLDYNGWKVVDRLQLPELIRMVIPDSLNTFFQEQLAWGRQGRKISATSLGPMFIESTPQERRELIYRLCLGQTGFFEEKNFQASGKKVLDKFLAICTNTQIPQVGADTAKRTWSPVEVETVGTIILSAFESMESGRRTEIFSRVINLIAAQGGRVSKEQLIKIGLTAFETVGAKVGQMDELIPQDLRESLGSLKEDIDPVPKLTIAKQMEAEGRTDYYVGLGPVIGAASTAAVYLARRVGSEDEDAVVKFLRPDALKHINADLNTVGVVVATLRNQGRINVDPTQIIKELQVMIAEEFNPQNEAANLREVAQNRARKIDPKRLLGQILRVKAGSRVAESMQSPAVYYAGKTHIEMSRAFGISVARFERIVEKVQKGEQLNADEQKYSLIDPTFVYSEVLADFFHEAFVLGKFHTDLHGGNILISEQGQLTKIDYGQVGTESSVDKRRAFVEFTLGVGLSSPKIVAAAICRFAPNLSEDEVSQFLLSRGDLVNGASEALTNFGVTGSINRFAKALTNVYPYSRQLSRNMLQAILTPYLLDAALVMDIDRVSPDLVSGTVKQVIARASSRAEGFIDRSLLGPTVDILTRLDDLSQDPQAQELLKRVLDSGKSGLIFGGELLWLLKSGKSSKNQNLVSVRRLGRIMRGLVGADPQSRQDLDRVWRAGKQATDSVRGVYEALRVVRSRRVRELISANSNQAQLGEAIRVFEGENE